MSEVSTLRSVVFDKLENWPGYESFRLVIESFPDIAFYIAGGVVRDSALNPAHSPKDFDIFFPGNRLDAILSILSKGGLVEWGPYGSPRWYPHSSRQQYCDLVPISNFVGGLWPCEDILDVLNQFEITGNAVAFDIRSGDFLNPQNGLRDLDRRVVRAVRFDFPDEPIVEGHVLRKPVVVWFRIMHYAATLDCKLDFVTRAWLSANRSHFSFLDSFTSTFFHPHCDLALLDQDVAGLSS